MMWWYVETILFVVELLVLHIGCIFLHTSFSFPLHTRFVTVCMHVLPLLIMKLNCGDDREIFIVLHIDCIFLHTRFVTVCMHVLPLLIMKLNFGDDREIFIVLHIDCILL